ncbi:MAG: photosynthesis system II assembly factor Ycf48 [Coleofasciculaceae cyanobacterium SM2_3_26]|nr:photosynthesis system II assembly factor Ycf48 [Coleofasciculaceae cyanobacterium SM2_3_26]
MKSLLSPLKRLSILVLVACLCFGCSSVASLESNPWKVVQLPTEVGFLDIEFTDDLQHGWVVGSQGTVLETTDGGETWTQAPIGLDEDEKVQLTSVSFSGQEGWIVGKPALLLHTEDGGNTWTRVRLSERLPGEPNTITALGPQVAEMTTNVGAIYRTTDGGANWKAMVEEALGVIRNISRSPDGKYVAVSSRGNFYSVWQPGQSQWSYYNRNSSRRLQNMGFGKDGRLWMLARGGQVQFSQPDSVEAWEEAKYPEFATSWGLLDMDYRTPEELWVVGGSGQLLASFDGGQTWMKDREMENVASNFFEVKFFSPEVGYILGQQGILLKYEGA